MPRRGVDVSCSFQSRRPTFIIYYCSDWVWLFSFCVLQSCEICQEAFEMYWEEEEEEWHLRDALRVEGKVRLALLSLTAEGVAPLFR